MTPFFKNKFQEFLFVGCIMLAFIAFYIETDIYAPSFPQMMSYFNTNEDTIQMLLSMNFLGLCLSCLFWGPASDAFGRKPILCGGLTVFMVGSIGCALTDSLQWMILYRFFQGVGCGAIIGSGSALFFDAYAPEQSSRLISICNGAVGGMMALAPMLGNWIALCMGWRANFYLIALLAIFSCFSVWLCITETLPVEKRIKLSVVNVLKNYYSLLTNFPFMAHTLIWCLGFSMIIVFIANLSLIFVDYLQVPKELFGYYQAAIMGAYFVGSMSGAYMIKKLGMATSKGIGDVAYIGGIILLIILTLLEISSPFMLIVAMALASIGSALAGTIYFTYSMMYVDASLKGSTMSLTQPLRFALTSGLVAIAAHGFDGTTKAMTVLAFICTGICVALYASLYRRKQHRPPAVASEVVVS